MKKRIIGFSLITLIYILISVGSVFLFEYMPFDLYLNIMLADIVSTTIIFGFSLIFKNASAYDPYWSYYPILVFVYLFIKFGYSLPRLLILIAILLWGIRLTLNWAYTFDSIKHEDWRYKMLKEKSGFFYPVINYLGIHMFPTVVVYMVMLPAILLYPIDFSVNVGVIIGFVISIIGMLFELFADLEMHKYRKNRTTPFNRNGLWRYSRHPNYLGEILMWWGIAIFTTFSFEVSIWWCLIGAILNTLLFLFISIPMADNRQSRKEGFEIYKSQTRMLLPIYKRDKNGIKGNNEL